MMTRLAACLAAPRRSAMLAALVVSFAIGTGSAAAQEASAEVRIGERFTLESEVLEEERAYWVYLPASYDDERFAPQSYPVLYLLDGDAHFHSASGVVQFMSTGINGNMQAPEMIVVAIPNTDRTRDLTPTATTSGYDGSEIPEMGGGGDEFLRFIRDELFGKIEATYRTRPYRIFVGHSLGGLIALHALMDQPDMFQSIIAIDPSLWWDDQLLVERASGYFGESTDLSGAVYMTLANNPSLEPGRPSLMRRAGEAFFAKMDAARSDRFRPGMRYFEGEDHGSVPLLSLYHGLLHVFDGYKAPLQALMEDPSKIVAHFAAVSERLGVSLSPPEAVVNQLGYFTLGQDIDKAIQFFEINVESHPGSYNAHDSLGEAYEAKGETDLAIASYERSLELNPANTNASERIAALRGG